MSLEYLCKRFGMSSEEVDQLQTYFLECTALLVGGAGRGGSGVVVELDDGSTGIFTAAHVVFACLLSGELTVLPGSMVPARSFVPTWIRLDDITDTALLKVPDNIDIPARVPYADWRDAVTQAPPLDLLVISNGGVGEWKEGIDVTARTIAKNKVLHYWGPTVAFDSSRKACCIDVDESEQTLPASFAGMSGGPVFSSRKKLLGLNATEVRHLTGSTGRLWFTPLKAVGTLLHPFDPGVALPPDCGERPFVLDVVAEARAKPDQIEPDGGIIVRAKGAIHHSEKATDARFGLFGRMSGVYLAPGSTAADQPISVESLFYPQSMAPVDLSAALCGEIDRLLNGTGFRVPIQELFERVSAH